MTEDKAREKWCPFARTWGGPEGLTKFVSTNRYSESGEAMFDIECHCIASDCACWQWKAGAHKQTKPEGFCGLTNGVLHRG